MDENRIIRGRIAGLSDELGRPGAQPGGSGRQLVQIADLGLFPRSNNYYFAAFPAALTGNEAEGEPDVPVLDTDPASLLYVLGVGPKVPVLGELLVAKEVGGRWAVQGSIPGKIVHSGCCCPRIPKVLTLLNYGYTPTPQSFAFGDAYSVPFERTFTWGPRPTDRLWYVGTITPCLIPYYFILPEEGWFCEDFWLYVTNSSVIIVPYRTVSFYLPGYDRIDPTCPCTGKVGGSDKATNFFGYAQGPLCIKTYPQLTTCNPLRVAQWGSRRPLSGFGTGGSGEALFNPGYLEFGWNSMDLVGDSYYGMVTLDSTCGAGTSPGVGSCF